MEGQPTFGGGQGVGVGVEGQQGVEAMPMASDILDPLLRPRIVPRGPVTTPPTGTSPSTHRWNIILTQDLDMNDLETLGFYTTMQLFRNDPKNQGMTLQFPSTLSAEQRQIVRSLAVRLNLDHLSIGNPPERYIAVTRRPTPPLPQDHNPLLHPSGLFSPPSIPEFGYTRPFPTTRASTDHLVSSQNDPRPLLYDTPTLRHSRSTGNLYGEADFRKLKDPPPPVPSIPSAFHHFSQQQQQHQSLVHRHSQDSAVSSNRSQIFTSPHGVVGQPTRQPIGPPQEAARGFNDRPSREFGIRPIGHGAKPPSHGTASGGSRGSSDTVMDLQIQSPPPPPSASQRQEF